MGLFNGPPVTDAQRELVAMTDARTREWYLEAEITMLNMRIAELEHHLNRAKKVLEPFAKQLAWKLGRYVGDLPIVARSPHEEVKEEMTFKLHDFRMAHLIWENISEVLGEKK